MERQYLTGTNGIRLAADVAGDPSHQPVVMLHGGGQTRHSWGALARVLGNNGYYAVNVDMRGHGESEWCPDSDYTLDRFVEDVHQILENLTQPPVLIGASLGGISSMIAAAAREADHIRGLVLVDIVPKMEVEGIQRIRDFMLAHLNGFDSMEEVVDAVSAYMPQRKRAGNSEGLRKNLRQGEDGRLYWHWDPALMVGERTPNSVRNVDRLRDAARRIQAPTLLVRGKMSDVVSEEGVKDFLELIPGSRAVDVSGAGHMVSGDQNDVFNDAILDFLAKLDQREKSAVLS
ncbi:Pimeloyl-ACP methyl ester carboxylesterase [Marinobacter daqiaonensis]|uniref:Pimeloyl-ACP methyl ester carboxylesterase n=1 Tax=Marinobacter daqiaonensis TaxID=650891 RepID=A0A1I6JT84_9GAMM|nr:alpha/beta hydrolase [Marinobacter daqiaonensis]SFR82118.1 Pimeloyl-ACP methyl ester carboxylesterase [Marinobacter daqiaonensis]